MSEGYHHRNHQQGIFSFPSEAANGFVAADQHQAATLHPGVYESPASAAGTLSEMFSFAGVSPPELHPQIPDSAAAAAMQLFLTDPNQRSPTPPSHHHHHHHQHQPPPTHMLLPSQGFTGISGHQPHLTWAQDSGIGGGQGLSLSLSSTLEAAKAEEVGGGMMFISNQEAPSSSYKNLEGQLYHNQNQHVMQLQQGYHHSGHFGFGSSPVSPGLGLVNALRNSKYTRPAQELLEEFCSVGRGHVNKNKLGRNNSTAASTSGGGGEAGPSKDPPPLSAADRTEHQRRKVKLLTMLDEVERRYSHYCEQMQMVVNSYDVVMGYGAAIPYTALAQKAMSRHFRCLKDAIQGQLEQSCEALGEKEGFMGLTKGETPRLKVLEQSLRQQRAFHQMGMMEHDAAAWRPQRGLPERSLNVLRAWLFEHFLHPYPSDADKHLLARQTGLSRNQVSNWFINARVRLWKPMVEEMYQQESKEEEDDEEEEELSNNNNNNIDSAQTPMHSSTTTTTTKTTTQEAEADATGKRSQINAPETESDNSFFAINSNPIIRSRDTHLLSATAADVQEFLPADACGGSGSDVGPTMIRFGTGPASAGGGDVSLTLGLRHSAAGGGSQAEKSAYSFRDFGG